VTQQNAAMVEQATAASHSLTGEAEELTRLVGQFKTGAQQKSRALHAAPPKALVTTRPAADRGRAAPVKEIAPPSKRPAAVHSQEDNWSEF